VQRDETWSRPARRAALGSGSGVPVQDVEDAVDGGVARHDDGVTGTPSL
jgi:hypothetical protein